MNYSRHTKLDNPVWHSLSEDHAKFSLDFGDMRFYHPDYCPFGSGKTDVKNPDHIGQYAELVDKFFIVGEQPKIPAHLQVQNKLVCLQMVINRKIISEPGYDVVRLNDMRLNSLLELVNLVQPGYFRPKTALLGNYFGIYEGDILIAVAGERMKMYDCVEVSAVVTHPDHRGKGCARTLVAHAVNTIFDENKIPYLHVAESNRGAINLYNDLGFVLRRKIDFWKIGKALHGC